MKKTYHVDVTLLGLPLRQFTLYTDCWIYQYTNLVSAILVVSGGTVKVKSTLVAPTIPFRPHIIGCLKNLGGLFFSLCHLRLSRDFGVKKI